MASPTIAHLWAPQSVRGTHRSQCVSCNAINIAAAVQAKPSCVLFIVRHPTRRDGEGEGRAQVGQQPTALTLAVALHASCAPALPIFIAQLRLALYIHTIYRLFIYSPLIYAVFVCELC